MKLRLALALSTLALPAYAQSLPTPNLGSGTKLNGANLQNAATKATGTSVADPGTGALENLLPVQTFTGASHTFVAADLYKETRRSNSGSAMTDTFPGTSTAGLVNGTTIQLNNVDTTAGITLSAGTGTTLNGNSSASIPPNRSTKWVYDAPNTAWRTTMNSLAGVNGPSSATSGNIASFSGSSGALIQDSGKALPSGTIVGTSDTQTLTNKSLDASAINSGTLASARGGAGTINGALKGNGSGVTSQAACGDLSNATAYCSATVGQLPGTATNDNASAGNLGEYVFSMIVLPGVSLSSGTAVNLTSISLTAGDWDLYCEADFFPAATTTVGQMVTQITTLSGTLVNATGENFSQLTYPSGTVLGNTNVPLKAGPMRASLSATTTHYCVMWSNFGTSTMQAWGTLRARRLR